MSKYDLAMLAQKTTLLESNFGKWAFSHEKHIKDAQFIDVSNIVPLAYGDESETLFRDGTPAMPPFSVVWFEWRHHKSIDEFAKFEVEASRFALLFVEVEPESLQKLGAASAGAFKTFVASLYMRHPDGRTAARVSQAVVTFAEDGRASHRAIRASNPGEGIREDANRHIFNDFCKPALLALSLLNCKNVRLDSPLENTGLPKKRRKKKVPEIVFKTLKIPGGGGGGSVSSEVGDTPFHMVRGHFKTYTEDAPLMGRLTGTYWWGWQARGRKKNGIVVKDYEVAKGEAHV